MAVDYTTGVAPLCLYRFPRVFSLLAIDSVVLCGGDLPLAVALQPGIGPDLAYLRLRMRFVFADGVLAAINDGHVFAEKMHPGIVDSAAARRVWTSLIAQFILFGVALAASAGALEVVGQQLRDNSIVSANAFGPLALHVDHELRGFVVGCGPAAGLGVGGGCKEYDAGYDAQGWKLVTHWAPPVFESLYK